MTPTLRFRILRRDGHTCRYCGQAAPAVKVEVDHIDPKANGGLDTDENLVTACFACNRGKRDKLGILPPPLDGKPAPYPIGMFFNAHAEVFGAKRQERRDNIWAQGTVIAVQGDDVWCEVCNSDGFADRIRALAKNGWQGWDFFETAREMRYQTTVEGYNAGFLEQSDVVRFEEHDATRFDDYPRLDAFYRTNPRFKPNWWVFGKKAGRSYVA